MQWLVFFLLVFFFCYIYFPVHTIYFLLISDTDKLTYNTAKHQYV